ncbi:MAG: carboxypeptidase regulatory-like domain-containing protein [Roseivirga sp.]|nr:carboxypeptidase regulatory-like domain-containing protein [Roseivirga sp.]
MNSDQAVYIPLKRGVQIVGNILLQKAQYSALGEGGMKLNGIRVTATDGSGETYTSLTDLSGQFRLYVPFGTYTIRVNEQAIDSQFEFAQSSYTLDVNNLGGNYQLAFYLIEKRRQLNIKKFDNNNDNK